MDERIKKVDAEMQNNRKRLKAMRKKIPLGIASGIAISFVLPYVPGRSGNGTPEENWGYLNSVIVFIIIFFIIYLWGYQKQKEKLEKEMRALKLKKHLIEEEIKRKT